MHDDVFHASLAERRSEIKAAQGTIIQIYSETSSAALREQRSVRIQHVLDEFKVLDRLTHHARAPIPLIHKER